MTTYDGRNPDFGKFQTANREPLFVSKYIYQKQVMKRHEVHMQRLQVAKSMTETNFDWSACKFMEDRISQNYQNKIKSIAITKDNLLMLDRLSKIRQTSGPIAQCKPHESPRRHMKRLKALDRKKEQQRIVDENKIVFSRFRSTKPYYSADSFNKAQETHDSMLELRRTDNTAGHLLTKKSYSRSAALPKIIEYEQLNANNLSTLPNNSSSALFCLDSDGTSTEMENISIDASSCIQSSSRPSSRHSSRPNSRIASSRPVSRSGCAQLDQSMSALESVIKLEVEMSSDDDFCDKDDGSDELLLDQRFIPSKHEIVLSENTVPVLSTNCQLKAVYLGTDVFRENIQLQLFDSSRKRMLAERVISIDDVSLIIDTNVGKESDEQNTVRTMLSNMFEEADADKSGYLTFDELSNLMTQIEVGILPHELRLVMSEADEDDNGLIDYHEFVPLAVDLIQSFRCRQEGLDTFEADQAALETEANLALNIDELKTVCNKILVKCRQSDSNNSGSLSTIDFKHILRDPSVSLSPAEVNLVCQTMPRNAVRRIIYSTILESVTRVRLDSVKNAITEARGTELHRYLLSVFKKEEKRSIEPGDTVSKICGQLSVRAFLRALVSAARLSLSRVQAMVIVSGCKISGGFINYYQLVPSVAKMIERMFDGKVLRERAQMIESADFNPEALLRGTNPETLLKRLKTLFSSLDTDRSGELDPDEFKGLLDSLDMKLTEPEILALMAGADVDGNGKISFDEFAVFCSHHLLELEKEKQIRTIQNKLCPIVNDDASVESLGMNSVSDSVKSTKSKEVKVLRRGSTDLTGDLMDELDKEITETESQLLSIFRCEDGTEIGSVSADFVVSVLCKLFLDISEDELTLISQEFILNSSGDVIYEDCVCQIATCLLKVSSASPRFTIEFDTTILQSLRHDYASTAATLCTDTRHLLTLEHTSYSSCKTFFQAASGLSNDKIVKMIMANRGCLSIRQKTALIVRLLAHSRGKIKKFIDVSAAATTTGWEQGLEEYISKLKGIGLARYHFMSRGEHSLNTLVRESLEQKDAQSLTGSVKSSLIKRRTSFDETDQGADVVRSCITIPSALYALTNIDEIQLSPDQILWILAWCDGIDSQTGRIDIVRFSFYAARLIEKMFDKLEIALSNNVTVVSHGLEFEEIMNGLTDAELQHHFESGKTMLGSISDFISIEDATKLVESVPNIQLSNRETQCIVAYFSRQNEQNICFSEMTKVLFDTICRMRLFVMIQRRIPLYKIWNQTMNKISRPNSKDNEDSRKYESNRKRTQEATRNVSKVSSKMLKRIIIRVSKGQQYRILFPSEAVLENRKSNLGRSSDPKEDELIESSSQLNSHANVRDSDVKELCRFGFSSRGSLSLVTIFESTATQMLSANPFEVEILKLVSMKTRRVKLTMHIPTIVMADHESAIEFAKNAAKGILASNLDD